jgi:hypothetical protein
LFFGFYLYYDSPFLVDACYIYLYNIGRKAFELNPIEENLLANNQQASSPQKDSITSI